MTDTVREALPEPDQAAVYYCNKCGYYESTGPVHINCRYHAVRIGPWWGEEKMRAALAAPVAQPPIASDSYDRMYDKVDRFLRCNLGDDDYAEYSAALDSLAAPVVAQPLTDEQIDAVLPWWPAPSWRELARAVERAHGIGSKP